MSLLEQYRYISGRVLLTLPKLGRCQDLPSETWITAADLWHVVFISHRWGSLYDPDPNGSQLDALQQLVHEILVIAELISDAQAGKGALQDRLTKVPSLNRQGTLQAAHLVFRCLCDGEGRPNVESIWNNGRGILDVIGFWYDFACLPQDPKTPTEEKEFAQSLQNIGELLLLPQVSTLILRKEEDGYLSRGWCFAESILAQSKNDTAMPMVLWTDQWNQPFSVFEETAMAAMQLWETMDSQNSSWLALSAAIQLTALPLVLRGEPSTSEFSLAMADTTMICMRLLAHIQPRLLVLQEGETVNLAEPLATLLKSQGLRCRDQRDAILVALLLLKSITSEDWRQAMMRFVEELPLEVMRCNGALIWKL